MGPLRLNCHQYLGAQLSNLEGISIVPTEGMNEIFQPRSTEIHIRKYSIVDGSNSQIRIFMSKGLDGKFSHSHLKFLTFVHGFNISFIPSL